MCNKKEIIFSISFYDTCNFFQKFLYLFSFGFVTNFKLKFKNIDETRQLKEKMENLIKDKKISPKSKVMYVNDGSKDKTWDIIQEIYIEKLRRQQ